MLLSSLVGITIGLAAVLAIAGYFAYYEYQQIYRLEQQKLAAENENTKLVI